MARARPGRRCLREGLPRHLRRLQRISRGNALEHTVSTLRLFIDTDGRLVRTPADRRQTVVVSPTSTDRVWEGFESAAVRVLPGFADLALAVQRRVVLETVHAAARGLASFRGLAQSALETARQAVNDAGFVFAWASAW